MIKEVLVKPGENLILVEIQTKCSKSTISQGKRVLICSHNHEPHSFGCFVEPGDYIIKSDGKIGEVKIGYRELNEDKNNNDDINDHKRNFLDDITKLSFQIRRNFLPDYQVQNAVLGIYDKQRTESIKQTIEAFRQEYYRIKDLVDKAKFEEDLKKIKPNFPDKLVE